jgi:predicted ATPase
MPAFAVVLDNCEHVIDPVARLTDTFVRQCPHISVLATSRETLRIEGEYIYRVPPLDVPPPQETDPDTIRGYGAVQLFIARTRALDVYFGPNDEHWATIAAICRRLDGIPLTYGTGSVDRAWTALAECAMVERQA